MLPFGLLFLIEFLDLECGVPGSLGCLTRPFRWRMELRRHSKPEVPTSSSEVEIPDWEEGAAVVEEEEEEEADAEGASFSQKR